MNNNELYHYGVLGMKWGVRRYQNKDGSLNAKGKKKFYDEKGNLNKAGKRAKKQAQRYQLGGNASTKSTVAISALAGAISYKGFQYARDCIHMNGNMKITALKMAGASSIKTKATAAAFIAGMGAITYMQVSPHARNISNNLMYKHDKDYKSRVDSLANMKGKIKR